MTQEEIIEYNKRCAEFLGWKYVKDGDVWNPDMLHDYSFVYSQNLKFHSDWNWIMEVVEAIEKLADWTLECLNYPDGSRNYQMMIPLSGTNIINNDKKEAVVEAINQFLIWYEKNN